MVIVVGSSLCVYPGFVPQLSWSKLCKLTASQNCPSTPYRTRGQQALLSKNYGKLSRIAKFRRNLQESDQKTCPNPQEIIGIVLTDCKSIGPEPLWIVMPGNSWLWTEQLSEVSSNCWQCALGLQKLQDVDWQLSDLSGICRSCLPKLQNALENFTICMLHLPNSAQKSNNCTYKVQKPLPETTSTEMWGCTLYAFKNRQPLPRNIRVTDLTEKYFWGINLVIGYRSATEKYSQIILVIILAATVVAEWTWIPIEAPLHELDLP